MKVCFLTNGPIKWASARYRGFWIAECRDDWSAHELALLGSIPEADVYVFAKAFDPRLVKELLRQGKRIYWDLCDPLHWFSPNETREMLELVDGVVCSNKGLADDLQAWAGDGVIISVIPDRLKLSHYDKQREHDDVSPVRFIWFGAAQNRAVLYPGFVTLSRLKANGYNVELTIMDDRPDMPLYYGPDCPVYFQRWALDTEVEVIANHDIVLLPNYPGMWGKVKSNNKTLTAWACGVPVLPNRWHDGLLKMIENASTRQKIGDSGKAIVKDQWMVDKSADDWEILLCAS